MLAISPCFLRTLKCPTAHKAGLHPYLAAAAVGAMAGTLEVLAMYLGDCITSIVKASKILLSTQAAHCQDKCIHTHSAAEYFLTYVPKEERVMKTAKATELTLDSGGRKLMDL